MQLMRHPFFVFSRAVRAPELNADDIFSHTARHAKEMAAVIVDFLDGVGAYEFVSAIDLKYLGDVQVCIA